MYSFNGVLLILIALISYSPEDPNFIFQKILEIKNVLGYQGSVTSDFILQSIGLIGYLLPSLIFFTGLNIFRKKEILIIIENTFFLTIYIILDLCFFQNFTLKILHFILMVVVVLLEITYQENFLINLLNRI